MKCLGVTMVKNEADIIESFVRHNLGHLDGLVILDHASIDNTPAILSALAKEGLPIHVERTEYPHFKQHEFMTELAKQCFRHGAEYVVPLDADEFLSVPESASLLDIVSASPRQMHAIQWVSHIPMPKDDQTQLDPVRRIIQRLAHEPNPTYKCILSKNALPTTTWSLSMGSHTVLRRIKDGGESFEAMPLNNMPDGFSLRHYPIRSEAQFVQKTILGWKSTEPLLKNNRHLCFHWLDAFEYIKRHREMSPDALMLRAMYYQEREINTPKPVFTDPLPATHELRYTDLITLPSISDLLKWFDDTVIENDSLSSSLAQG